MRGLNGSIHSMDMSLSKPWEMVNSGKPGVLQSVDSQSRAELSDPTTKGMSTAARKDVSAKLTFEQSLG